MTSDLEPTTSESLQAPLLPPASMDPGLGEGETHGGSPSREAWQDETSDSGPTPLPSFQYQWMARIANFSTSYNVVNISLVLVLLQELLPDSTPEDAAASASSLLGGMMVGQLVGGALGDVVGRGAALGLVLMIQIIASLVTASLPISEESTFDFYRSLAIWRFILGMGAGGVYPLAAVLSAEDPSSSSHQHHNQDDEEEQDSTKIHNVVWTFSTQGWGFVAAPLLTVTLLYTLSSLNMIWRLILGAGSLPGMLVLGHALHVHWRQRRVHAAIMPLPSEEPDALANEHSNETIDHQEAMAPAEIDQSELPTQTVDESALHSNTSIWTAVRNEPKLGSKLLGTAGAWFLFDVLFYGNTLFEPIVLEAAFGGGSKQELEKEGIGVLRETAVDSLILTSLALPGYLVAGWVLGIRCCGIFQTPRYVMLQGFAVMALLYLGVGASWTRLKEFPVALVLLYGGTFFFANYGPNTTTFLLPSLTYSPACRSTLNGVSAAAGKLGALCGALVFDPAAQAWGDSHVLLLCSGIAAVAFGLTWAVIPSHASARNWEPIQEDESDAGPGGSNRNTPQQ